MLRFNGLCHVVEMRLWISDAAVILCVQTYHQVHFEGVVELQGWDVVRLLEVMNHEQFSVLETSCALEKLLQTFLTDKNSKCSFKE